MKIGILTFQKTNNYGASLQAYALYKYLANSNANVEVINYQNSKMENDYTKAYSIPSGFYAKLKYFIFFRNFQIARKKAFLNFSKLIRLSPHSYSERSNLEAVSQRYDKIIVGSDQVWNYNITGNDWNFYLSFVPISKSYSYAASIGIDSFDSKFKERITDLLCNYAGLSAREQQAIDLLEQNGIYGCKLVADPTLLLTKNEWKELINTPLIRGSYILLYSFGLSDDLRNFVVRLAKTRKMRIIYIDGSPKYMFNKTWKSVNGIGPAEWVNLFYFSSLIVTNSFHGTVFSINFGKEFYTDLLPPPSKVNSRLLNILNYFGLNNRIIKNGECESENKTIDYIQVKSKLSKLRDDSYTFLHDIIESKTFN